jgi:hypothetical protein
MTSAPTGRQSRRSAQRVARWAWRLVRQSALGLRGVEVDVPPFLPHDAAQEFGQRGMTGPLRQSGVAGLGGPLVDRSPGHVEGDEVATEQSTGEHHRQGAELPPAQRAP